MILFVLHGLTKKWENASQKRYKGLRTTQERFEIPTLIPVIMQYRTEPFVTNNFSGKCDSQFRGNSTSHL